MKIKGWNKENIELKVTIYIRNGEKEIKIEPLSSSDCIKKLDLYLEYIHGFKIPLLFNREFGMGKNVYTQLPIEKQRVWGEIHDFEHFLKYLDTPGDLRRLYIVGKDEKGNNLHSYNTLQLNFK